MSPNPTVFVIDDDQQSRESVAALVSSMGVPSQSFESAEEFLDFYKGELPGCVVTDFRLTGRNGVELQEELRVRRYPIPVIVLTGFARTPVTVRAMRNGAVTMLDKPYHDDELWQAIREALVIDAEQRERQRRRTQVRARLEKLTPSEHHVLRLIVEGIPNKIIAQRLDVSERTVESRRHQIFVTMQASSVAELVRMVLESDTAD